jgi:hypothetical protein
MIDLHDAVLEDLRLDYRGGTVLVVFSTSSGEVHLKAEGVFMVRAPRREPRGRGGSEYVHEVRGPGAIYADSPAVHVEVQLKSGDVLEIEARQITIAPPEENGGAPVA